MLETLKGWLNQGLNITDADILARSLIGILIILLGFISNIVSKRFILKGISSLIARSTTRWDDMFLQKKVFNRLALLVPAIIIYIMAPIPLDGYDRMISLISGAVLVYIIVISILAIDSFLNASLAIYRTYDISKEIPIKGFIQVIKIIIYFVGSVFIISILLNKTPIYFFSGLGALTAILMFIFKDAILGFVAGIQLTANKMVAYGDWIEMPKYGADGDVVEVALTTVKVQNFDKTIITIPTYALISESFKNWRGMSESQGRRIKRSINIDINTIQLCSEEMLERYAKIQYIAAYIEKKKNELADFNKEKKIDNASLVNGRRMTNVGTFRAYVVAYLKNHPMINQDMTFLVRQLAPKQQGLPIEIYVFCKDKVWVNYENIQADIFDHIFAVVQEFDLLVFQEPSGSDFSKIINR